MFHWFILIVAAWFTATISGIIGFGGSLIMVPIASYFIGVKQAIPILTIAWMMGNITKALLGFKEIRWKPVLYFCAGAIPLAILGSNIFVELPPTIILKIIGFFLLVIAVLRQCKIKLTIPEKSFIFWGALVGFLSAIVGSAGPIGAVAFLSLNLPPTAYVASEAVTAVVMHVTKTTVYGNSAILAQHDVFVGIILGLAMVIGSWTGRKFIKKLDTALFSRIVDWFLVVVAVLMIVR